MIDLKIGVCCSTCEYSSKPKSPTDTHAAHYTVAKTERWCFLHNCNIVRESCCESYNVSNNAGRSIKRVLKFNERLELIKQVSDKIGDKQVLIAYGCIKRLYMNCDGYLSYKYDINNGRSYRISSKENSHDKYMKEILDTDITKLTIIE